ncbi:MAG: dihydropteroate synthase [Chloroflexi bacterium]|nr:dihydropteroate synthase [Chloroflexota bacterium]
MPAAPPRPIEIGGRRFEWGTRTYVMGIVNVTPDSLSGDGVLDAARAADQAARMVAEGADLIDVGSESTRPGHAPLSVADEWARLEAPLRAIRAAVDTPITVDTSKAGVAERAFDAGADALNDVRGLLGDADLAPLLARHGLPAVVMHNQRDRAFGGDVIADIRAGLRESIEVAERAGVVAGQLIVDPGFGFGWEPAQNLEMVRRLGELRDLGRPLLVGVSRKSTLGLVLDKPEDERAWGTAAAVALSVQAGADIVRVHDVAEMVDVVKVADAISRPGAAP